MKKWIIACVLLIGTLQKSYGEVHRFCDFYNAQEKQVKLNEALRDASVVRLLLKAYLGEKGELGFPIVNRNQMQVAVDAPLSVLRLNEKFPFLQIFNDGIFIEGTGDFVPRIKKLRSEFGRLVILAACLNKRNNVVRNLAFWGNKTKVIYPDKTFGEPIFPTKALFNLNLE